MMGCDFNNGQDGLNPTEKFYKHTSQIAISLMAFITCRGEKRFKELKSSAPRAVLCQRQSLFEHGAEDFELYESQVAHPAHRIKPTVEIAPR